MPCALHASLNDIDDEDVPGGADTIPPHSTNIAVIGTRVQTINYEDEDYQCLVSHKRASSTKHFTQCWRIL